MSRVFPLIIEPVLPGKSGIFTEYGGIGSVGAAFSPERILQSIIFCAKRKSPVNTFTGGGNSN